MSHFNIPASKSGLVVDDKGDKSGKLEVRLIDPSLSPADFTSFTTEPVKRGRVEIKHNVS